MAENSAPTLVPQKPVSDVLTPEPTAPSQESEKQALFDSIAGDKTDTSMESESSSFKTFFTGLLWFGYAIAIGVAVVLVWSAAGALLKSLPR